MKRTTWILIALGLFIGVGMVCGGMVGLFVWLISGSDSSSVSSGPAFGPAIGVVRVEGTIMPGNAPAPSPFSAETGIAYSGRVVDHLKQANEDDNVQAVVLYVDSPGGSVYASDEIYQQILKMEKPVIVSMGSMAASGGYYISAPADEIWATSSTLTCSIGVISQFLDLNGFSEKYGVSMNTIKSGRFKDAGNPFREFATEDQALWQEIIDDIYGDFVSIVAVGRDMDEMEVRQKADGRVCTGKQALEMGFVDELGYFDEVVERAAELGGIDGEPRIQEYGGEPDIWTILSGASTLQQPSPVEELDKLLNYHQGSPLMYLYVGP